MYFLHLELTFTPHYIITDKGLLWHHDLWSCDTIIVVLGLVYLSQYKKLGEEQALLFAPPQLPECCIDEL